MCLLLFQRAADAAAPACATSQSCTTWPPEMPMAPITWPSGPLSGTPADKVTRPSFVCSRPCAYGQNGLREETRKSVIEERDVEEVPGTQRQHPLIHPRHDLDEEELVDRPLGNRSEIEIVSVDPGDHGHEQDGAQDKGRGAGALEPPENQRDAIASDFEYAECRNCSGLHSIWPRFQPRGAVDAIAPHRHRRIRPPSAGGARRRARTASP
jgi:hypothetical protein